MDGMTFEFGQSSSEESEGGHGSQNRVKVIWEESLKLKVNEEEYVKPW